MKRREKTETGIINNAGRLAMPMDELNQFFAQHKGSRVIARFSVVPAGTSEALRAYYYKAVVPEFRQAFWDNGERMTEEQTEERMREMSPVMIAEAVDPGTGRYVQTLRSVNELSNAELVEHIETLKQIAAEEFSVYIDDPKTI